MIHSDHPDNTNTKIQLIGNNKKHRQDRCFDIQNRDLYIYFIFQAKKIALIYNVRSFAYHQRVCVFIYDHFRADSKMFNLGA